MNLLYVYKYVYIKYLTIVITYINYKSQNEMCVVEIRLDTRHAKANPTVNVYTKNV